MGAVPIHDDVVVHLYCRCNWFKKNWRLFSCFVYVFCSFPQNVVCLKLIKKFRKMALSRAQRHEIYNRRAKRLFFLFMLWRIYSANTKAFWVHPINEMRLRKGEFYTLYPDLRHFTPKFFAMYRMNPRKFDRLLGLVAPRLERKWTKMRSPLSPEQKLVITLR